MNTSYSGHHHPHKKAIQNILIEQYLLHEIPHHISYTDISEAEQTRTGNQESSQFCHAPTEWKEKKVREKKAFPLNKLAYDSSGGTISQKPVAYELADIYKCLHQGVFGIGHSIQVVGQFRLRLESELSLCPADGSEPIVEVISTNEKVVRLNLRPFKYLFEDTLSSAVKILTEVCLHSAQTITGDPKHFLDSLHAFSDLNSALQLKVGSIAYYFESSEVEKFLLWIKKLRSRLGNFPVLSHSKVYHAFNKPAYRIVDIEVLKDTWLGKRIRDYL